MEKTLGGDRLGSGKKMKVHLHNYERSTHDIGYVMRTTMSAGTLVPFMCEVALPGTTFDINLQCDIKTHPTIGPLFGSYKAQMDVFLAPIRLYQAALHNNKLGIGRNMANVKLPLIAYTALPINGLTVQDLDNCQVNPSSLTAYLGIRGIGNPGVENTVRYFNAIPTLAYWEIYKNYYANKQEEIGAVIHNDNIAIDEVIVSLTLIQPIGNTVITKVPPGALQSLILTTGSLIQIQHSGTPMNPEHVYVLLGEISVTLAELCEPFINSGATTQLAKIKDKYLPFIIQGWNYVGAFDIRNVKPIVETFPLSNLDDMRTLILQAPQNVPFIVNDANLIPYKYLTEQPNGVPNILSSQEGLALKTYQSDLYNNWLKTENIEAISTATAVDTSSGSFTIDQLVISKKVWNMLNRINVSGGSYDDWLDAVYVHERYKSSENPMYMGGLIKELVFQEVVSNSESDSGQPLGTLAGKGIMSDKHKGGNMVINVDEPSYVIGIISLTPRIDYSQGNKWDVHLKTMDDFHKPPLDEIGFQELITEDMAWWDTKFVGGEWVQNSAGKQPAWINYMSNVNRCFGNFAIADNEMFMTLNRRFENDQEEPTIKDLTTYIDPSKFNFIFAETALDAQNFWTQIGVNIIARRKMSAKIMPNL